MAYHYKSWYSRENQNIITRRKGTLKNKVIDTVKYNIITAGINVVTLVNICVELIESDAMVTQLEHSKVQAGSLAPCPTFFPLHKPLNLSRTGNSPKTQNFQCKKWLSPGQTEVN